MAERFREMRLDPQSWKQPFLGDWESTAERAIAAHPSPSQGELDESRDVVMRFLENRHQNNPGPLVFFLSGLVLPLAALVPAAGLSLLSAPVFRGGLLLRMLGVGVVLASGVEVSRAKAFVRAFIAWLPFVLVGSGLVALLQTEPADVAPYWHVPIGVIAFLALPVVLVSLASWVAYDPRQGVHDRIAGTYLVPR